MHAPVLLTETISQVVTSLDGIYVDCTLGGGGHLAAMAKVLGPQARLIGIDKDLEILRRTSERFDDSRITTCHGDFRDLSAILARLDITHVQGIVIDLGVSSFQLDEPDRGFSFHDDAPLDMRMNREQALDAQKLVNEADEEELARIIYEYGEERFSRRIARAIVRRRAQERIVTTLQLVDVIKSAVPGSYKGEKHPARKTFQALRIAVNDELGALQTILPQAIEMLNPGGRLAVITFHSLEDRMVKHFFRDEAVSCTCPPDFPVCVCHCQPRVTPVRRKATMAAMDELDANPRSRSARLRTVERL